MATSKKRKTPARNSWTFTLLGLMLVAAAAVVGLVLLRDYLQSRPLHLELATKVLAARFEATLKESMVPSDAVRLESRRTERTADAVWNVYQYDVEIPPTLALDRVGDLLRDTLRDTAVVVQDNRQTPNEVALSLQLAEHEFLIARLHTAAPKTEAAVRPVTKETPEPSAEPQPVPEAPKPEDSTFDLSALLPWSWLPKLWPGTSVPSIIAPAPPRLAIILDDGGYGGPATDAVFALDPRLTLAILPYTPHAQDTAQRAVDRGFQVMLHMPMESNSPSEFFEGSLMTAMDPAEIDRLVQQALEQVPHAAGVNNHTGSKFSEDKPAVTAMLEALHRRGLFFIDSRTIHTTVAMQTACELGVPAAERDVFLDNDNAREPILRQWDALTRICRERGAAIGIGHFRELTAKILAEKLPELDDLGIELVHAGDLADCQQATN